MFSFIRKKLINCVRPGVALVFTRRFRLTIVLIKDDFPTLDRPTNAISGKVGGGYCEGFTALLINSADRIIIGFNVSNCINDHYEAPKSPTPSDRIQIVFESVHAIGDIFHGVCIGKSKIAFSILAEINTWGYTDVRFLQNIKSKRI